MRLIVVRHGPAGRAVPERDADDARTLTKKGRKETKAAMRGVIVLAGGLQRILTSPLPRSSETADILYKASKAKKPESDERLAPGADVMPLVAELAADDQVVAVVGHDPQLSRLVAQLSTGYKSPRPQFISLDKAGAAGLSYSSGAWSLDWVAGRDQLARVKTKT